MYDKFASDDAWDEQLGVNEIPAMDDTKALAIFRTTAFLHVGVKDASKSKK